MTHPTPEILDDMQAALVTATQTPRGDMRCYWVGADQLHAAWLRLQSPEQVDALEDLRETSHAWLKDVGYTETANDMHTAAQRVLALGLPTPPACPADAMTDEELGKAICGVSARFDAPFTVCVGEKARALFRPSAPAQEAPVQPVTASPREDVCGSSSALGESPAPAIQAAQMGAMRIGGETSIQPRNVVHYPADVLVMDDGSMYYFQIVSSGTGMFGERWRKLPPIPQPGGGDE